jgi:hypothetical protein
VDDELPAVALAPVDVVIAATYGSPPREARAV